MRALEPLCIVRHKFAVCCHRKRLYGLMTPIPISRLQLSSRGFAAARSMHRQMLTPQHRAGRLSRVTRSCCQGETLKHNLVAVHSETAKQCLSASSIRARNPQQPRAILVLGRQWLMNAFPRIWGRLWLFINVIYDTILLLADLVQRTLKPKGNVCCLDTLLQLASSATCERALQSCAE